MYCRKCGNKLEEGSAFCNYCGTQVITDKPSEEKEVIAEQEPVQEDVAKEIPSNTAKRSMKLPLIIGVGAAAVALVAGVVIFKPFGLFKTGTNDDGTIAGSDIGETASETAFTVGVDVLDYDGIETFAIDTEEDEQISSLDEAELQANRVAAYTKYLGILESAEESIRSYDDLDGLNCALIDVTGDGIEDLIYLCDDDYDNWACISVYSYNRFTTSAPAVFQTHDIVDFSDNGYLDGFIAVTNDGDLVIFFNTPSCYDWEDIECSVYSFDGVDFPSDPSLRLFYQNDESSSPYYSYGWGGYCYFRGRV